MSLPLQKRCGLLVVLVALISVALASCGRGSSTTNTGSTQTSADRGSGRSQSAPVPKRVNLNTATAEELTALPGIGDVIAKRIVDYRERHGRLRRPEEIIIIEGFSERKYRAIAELVYVD